MSRKNFIPIIAAALTGLVVVSAASVYVLFYEPLPSGEMAMAPLSMEYATSSLPTTLLIPHLGIDTTIEHVGVTASGAMATPSSFFTVAWYKYGVVPGSTGSAVIDGHVDNALDLNGVFKHLDELAVGQDVEVKNAAGQILLFRVIDSEKYPYQSVPTSIFTKNDGAYLNLITCAGTWQPAKKTYDERLIVYTKFIGVLPSA